MSGAGDRGFGGTRLRRSGAAAGMQRHWSPACSFKWPRACSFSRPSTFRERGPARPLPCPHPDATCANARSRRRAGSRAVAIATGVNWDGCRWLPGPAAGRGGGRTFRERFPRSPAGHGPKGGRSRSHPTPAAPPGGRGRSLPGVLPRLMGMAQSRRSRGSATGWREGTRNWRGSRRTPRSSAAPGRRGSFLATGRRSARSGRRAPSRMTSGWWPSAATWRGGRWPWSAREPEASFRDRQGAGRRDRHLTGRRRQPAGAASGDDRGGSPGPNRSSGPSAVGKMTGGSAAPTVYRKGSADPGTNANYFCRPCRQLQPRG